MRLTKQRNLSLFVCCCFVLLSYIISTSYNHKCGYCDEISRNVEEVLCIVQHDSFQGIYNCETNICDDIELNKCRWNNGEDCSYCVIDKTKCEYLEYTPVEVIHPDAPKINFIKYGSPFKYSRHSHDDRNGHKLYKKGDDLLCTYDPVNQITMAQDDTHRNDCKPLSYFALYVLYYNYITISILVLLMFLNKPIKTFFNLLLQDETDICIWIYIIVSMFYIILMVTICIIYFTETGCEHLKDYTIEKMKINH